MIDNSAIIIRDWKRALKGDVTVCDNYGVRIEITECITRYLWAREHISRGPTLDIPCGSGFGTAILSEKTTLAIGMDIDPNKIKICQESYPFGLYFEGDMLDTTFSDGRFMNIISIEGIEHVDNTDVYLRETKRLLADGGVFICSTANIAMHGMGNPCSHHKYAWDKEEFEEILESHFRVEKIEPIDCGRGVTSWIALCRK